MVRNTFKNNFQKIAQMNKKYIKPAIHTFSIQCATIMAGSQEQTDPTKTTFDETPINPDEALSKENMQFHYDIWE